MQKKLQSLLGTSLLVASAVALTACTDDPAGVPTTYCTAEEDCAEGFSCDLDLNQCVLIEDGDGADGDTDGDGDGDGTGGDGDGDGTGGDGDTDSDSDTDGDSDGDSDGEEEGDRRSGLPFDDSCVFVDRADTFVPDEKWFFQVDETLPYATYDGHGANNVFAGHTMNQVMMTPVVINLTDDNGDGIIDENDVPDVVFTTFATSQNSNGWDQLITGVLRAISGDDGSHHWSVGYKELSQHLGIPEAQWNPALGFMPAGSIAAGDINNDGTAEIIAPLWDYSAGSGNGPQGFAAVRHDGTILWISDDVAPQDIEFWWGGPSIADLNGDGNPQIIVGSVVYDNAGNKMWDGRDAAGLLDTNATGSNFGANDSRRIGPLSVVADLTREIDPATGGFTQEVITGNAAFRHDGTLLWQVDAGLEEGYPGVADFNGDGLPEVVVVSAGTVRIHNGQTGALIWQVDVPGAGRLGPPTIANLTGQPDGVDPRMEIGIAGSNGYFVLRVDYGLPGFDPEPSYMDVLVWEQTTQDFSSNTTGSSVFDFNGDGVASVVYNDELYLRVFDGPTGDILFEAENPSYTALENPVIVDVNNDGRANIIVPSSDFECGVRIQGCTTGMAGVRAFGDADDNWVATRRVWNQHAYSINNVNEDGTIPASPVPNYLDHNTFRLNTLTEILPQAAPDLFPEDPQTLSDGCIFLLDVWVTNSGAIHVGAGIPVSLYAENGANRVLLATGQTTAALYPGESERVILDADVPPGTNWDLVVVVDDLAGQSTRNECNEDNNRLLVEAGFSC